MKTSLVLTLLFCFSLVYSAVATADLSQQAASNAGNNSAYDTITAELAVGLGWNLCPQRLQPPPLDTAYICSGLSPGLNNIEVLMTPQPAADPLVKFYSGRHIEKVSFENHTFVVELLVSYVDSYGRIMAFVDGRIGNETTHRQVYFRGTGTGGFAQLQPTTVYGSPIDVPLDGGSIAELSPHFVFAAKY